MTDITLNCLIVPKGDLMGIPIIKVMQAITIDSSKPVSVLENEIQVRLEAAPFNTTSLSICQIHPEGDGERPMQSNTLISTFFTEKPQVDHFNVIVYPQ